MPDYTAENITDAIRKHADVLRGHDAVHPDRNVCGGVGGCALMMAEHDSLEVVTNAIERAVRRGLTVTVDVVAVAGGGR